MVPGAAFPHSIWPGTRLPCRAADFREFRACFRANLQGEIVISAAWRAVQMQGNAKRDRWPGVWAVSASAILALALALTVPLLLFIYSFIIIIISSGASLGGGVWWVVGCGGVWWGVVGCGGVWWCVVVWCGLPRMGLINGLHIYIIHWDHWWGVVGDPPTVPGGGVLY